METPNQANINDESSSSFSFDLDKKSNAYEKTNNVLKIHDDLMNKAVKSNMEDTGEVINLSGVHDPRRYQNRMLAAEIQRYHSKNERRIARKLNSSKKKIKI